jgi:hypothetical protein
VPRIQELPECPKIIFDAEGIDIDAIPTHSDGEFPKELEMKDLGISDNLSDEEQVARIAEKREEIVALLRKHGAVHLKSVPVAQDVEGFRLVQQALGFQTCQDPLSRKAVDNEIFRVVQSINPLEPHHDRSDYTPQFNLYDETIEHPRLPRYSAFVCITPAVKGGAFQLLDAQRMVREVDRSALRELYKRKFRGVEVFGVMLPQSIIGMVVGWAQNVLHSSAPWKWKSLVNPDYEVRSYFEKLPKGWNNITSPPWVLTQCWRTEVLVPEQSPINRHPETGEVVWFNNMLFWAGDKKRWRQKFIDMYIPRSRPIYGDGGEIPQEHLDHIVAVADKNKVNIPMVPGDVVLVDNYRALHGREGFRNSPDQTRLHAISSGQQFDTRSINIDELKEKARKLSRGDGGNSEDATLFGISGENQCIPDQMAVLCFVLVLLCCSRKILKAVHAPLLHT